MVGKILKPEIRSLIEARNFAALREVFREWPPADVAEVILDMPEDEHVIIFRVLPQRRWRRTFSNTSGSRNSRNCYARWRTSRSSPF